jgi:hypothetical protein
MAEDLDLAIWRAMGRVGWMPKEDRSGFASSQKQRPGPFRNRALYLRFRYGCTACTRRTVYLHRASTTVSALDLAFEVQFLGHVA